MILSTQSNIFQEYVQNIIAGIQIQVFLELELGQRNNTNIKALTSPTLAESLIHKSA